VAAQRGDVLAVRNAHERARPVGSEGVVVSGGGHTVAASVAPACGSCGLRLERERCLMDTEFDLEVLREFAAVSKVVVGAATSAEALQLVVDSAVRMVPGAEHAGITTLRRGKFETPIASDEVPLKVDAIQYKLGSGPCVDAVLDDNVYVSGDIGTDDRWAEFGLQAYEQTGVRSMMSFRLFLEQDDTIAGLNFYARAQEAFPDPAPLLGMVLATHAGLAFAAAHRLDQLTHMEVALATNRNIGMAIGILMARHVVTQQQAFDLMRVRSQTVHRKLRDIAEDVIATGTLD
jgi:hypothetical protein